jgi:hypothetical protein
LRGLKQLRLRDCTLLDGSKGLAAALPQLPQLPQLEHLSLEDLQTRGCDWQVHFPTEALEQLQQLTFWELQGGCLLEPRFGGSNSLQPLRALTWLADLRLCSRDADNITAEMLSGLCCLTRLGLPCDTLPAMLVGKTRRQHVCIRHSEEGSAAGAAELLSQMQQLQQLTHLDLYGRLAGFEDGNPPAAAFAAITASSKLRHLDISGCTLPAGVWQHIFPAGSLPAGSCHTCRYY